MSGVFFCIKTNIGLIILFGNYSFRKMLFAFVFETRSACITPSRIIFLLDNICYNSLSCSTVKEGVCLDNIKLQELVETISITFFQKPFKHQAMFNPRLRSTGGRYLLGSHNIEVNKKYYELFGEKEIIGIIKHELCHYHLHIEGKGYLHRDSDFKQLLKKVDAPRFCTPLPNQKKKKTIKKIIVYACHNCSQVYKRKRAINTDKYVCGVCKGKLKRVEVLTEG